MIRQPRLYTLDAVDLDRFESLWTAPRPLIGRKIGYRAGTGFAVYAVHDDNIASATSNAADPIAVVTVEWQTARFEELEYVDAYRELIADGTMTVSDVLRESAGLIEIPLDLTT